MTRTVTVSIFIFIGGIFAYLNYLDSKKINVEYKKLQQAQLTIADESKQECHNKFPNTKSWNHLECIHNANMIYWEQIGKFAANLK